MQVLRFPQRCIWYEAASVGNWFLSVRVSKWRQPIIHWRSVISQNNGIFIYRGSCEGIRRLRRRKILIDHSFLWNVLHNQGVKCIYWIGVAYVRYNVGLLYTQWWTFGIHKKIHAQLSRFSELISWVCAYWLQAWKDEFLVWNMSEYGGINYIRLDGDSVWVPEVFHL
jgi:hypothetical protein